MESYCPWQCVKIQAMSKTRIALISPPWPLYNRPSIQLGALKAYLQANSPDVQVEASHFYLELARDIGYRLYQQISERTWIAESIYGSLLYPERSESIEKLFYGEARSNPLLKKSQFNKITSRAKQTTENFISSLDWKEFMLAGFSISLCQLTSGLYMIKRLKQLYPDLFIVIGGSTFSGTITGDFFSLFPEVDAVINGEGELPLSLLVEHLIKSGSREPLPASNGIITPTSSENTDTGQSFNQMPDLNQLPPPDYDDYFAQLKTFSPGTSFFPNLPIETSRGCWWQKTIDFGRTSAEESTRAKGCAFCNLNLQWKGYRHKASSRVVKEIDYLTGRHQLLSVSIVDNVLPAKSAEDVFKSVSRLNKDINFFAEIRANSTETDLKIMSQAGMQELQIGIEALSTSLLKKLHKGTSTIQNLEIMRNCEALGIVNTSNLILQFPGSDEQDVAETLRNLEFALPFRPLQAVNFWLGLGSPVALNPSAYGIQSTYNHPNWSRLFPPEVTRKLAFMIRAYRGDRGYQKKIWRPVRQEVASWRKTYTALQQQSDITPILSFRDGGDFMIITQRQHQADDIKHRLVGTSRLIYLFCLRHRSLKKIRSRFPKFAEDQIVAFLKMMIAKRLMFEENENYLSLAVPLRLKVS